MTRQKKKLIRNDNPNPNTLEVNMRKVAREGHFPLITAAHENERRYAGLPSNQGPEVIISNPRASRKIGTDLTE